MKIIPFYARGWEANSYLVVSDGHAALVDAGVSADTVTEALKSENATLDCILLTHGHFDHTLTAKRLCEETGAKLLVHESDGEMLDDAQKSALALFLGRQDTVRAEREVFKGGDSFKLGNTDIKVIHTPGHSKGSVCFLVDTAIFTGDTLFDGGFGRFDLYGGDFSALKSSLASLKSLDGNLDIYPGHGTPAKLGDALDILNI